MGEVDELRVEVARLGRVERRMERLLAVSGELVGARTAEDVARIAIGRGLPAVGAAYGGLWEIDRGALRLLEVSALPRGDAEAWRTMALEVDAPVPEAARTGEPVYVGSLADYAARYPASLERVRGTIAEADAAIAAVPVAAGGPPLAVLALTYAPPVELDAGERMFLGVLARQCGMALERVHIQRAAQLAAEDATRAREEILAVVSHDLRNPLGTILIGASTLLADVPIDGARLSTIGERIQRQSERMARLIDDLVDFGRIQAGDLPIARARHAPAALLAQAAELTGPLVRERGLRFDATSTPDLPLVAADAERAVQVVASLVTNAIKVTPKSGAIAIGAERDGREVVFFVRDTGPGLDPEDVPRVFERYWRSKTAAYRGAGLGLAIAKGIVDAHGGRIWATSGPGEGTAFRFTLEPAISTS